MTPSELEQAIIDLIQRLTDEEIQIARLYFREMTIDDLIDLAMDE